MTNGEGATGSKAQKEARQKRARPTRTLPTDRIRFEKQLELLRAYGSISGPERRPVTNKEVAELVGMQESTVGLANSFFTDIGFLRRSEEGFVPSDEVFSFAQAYKWMPEKAPQKLAPVVSDSWFAKTLLPRLSFGPTTVQEATAKLAEAATADKGYEKHIRTLIEYLEGCGLIKREGDQIVPAEELAESISAGSEEKAPATEPSSAVSRVTTNFQTPSDGVVRFHVDVEVDMKEFADWNSDRISAFFNGIASVLAAKGKMEKDATEK